MNKPAYVIAASVPAGNRVREFHGDNESSASYLLAHAPRFRSGGFDLTIPDDPKPGPEDSLEMEWPGRKLLRLYSDGSLLFRVAADHEFLGWGIEPEHFGRFPRINPVAAVEMHASFAYMYALVLNRLRSEADHVTVKLNLTGGSIGDQRLFLTRYYRDIHSVTGPRKYLIQADPAVETIRVDATVWRRNPDRAGYLILFAFASLFDLPEDEIPFTREGSDGREVDLDAIRAL